jgi:hypothetical protein
MIKKPVAGYVYVMQTVFTGASTPCAVIIDRHSVNLLHNRRFFYANLRSFKFYFIVSSFIKQTTNRTAEQTTNKQTTHEFTQMIESPEQNQTQTSQLELHKGSRKEESRWKLNGKQAQRGQ